MRLLLVLLTLCSLAVGQSTYIHDVAQGGSGIPFANILVCRGDGDKGPPCSPTVNLFSDQALTQPKSNPFQADAQGNFDFYSAETEPITIQISAKNAVTKTYTVSASLVGPNGGGGGLGSGSQHFTDLTLDDFLLIGGSSNKITSSDETGSGPIVAQNGGQTNNQLALNLQMIGPSTAANGPLGIGGPIYPVGGSNNDFFGQLPCSAGQATYNFQNSSYVSPPTCIVWDTTTSPPSFLDHTETLTQMTVNGCINLANYLCIGKITNIPVTSLAAETSNNTATCNPSGTQPGWCSGTFPSDAVTNPLGLPTLAANTTAQTPIPDPIPGHISDVPIQSMLYSGATTIPICHWQPWWSMSAPGYNGHIHIGYDQGFANTVAAQVTEMLKIGCKVVNPDWYGTDPGKATNQAHTLAMVNEIANRSGYPMKLLITIDKGALAQFCPMSTTTDQTTCLSSAFGTELDYIYSNWSRQPYYQVDPGSGKAIVATFIDETSWSASNWTTIMNNVCSHITSANGASIKMVKEFGNYTEACYQGAFAWPQPNGTYSATNQLCWDSNSCGSSYYDRFNTQSHAAAAGMIPIGYIMKGFDDNNASWGTNRVIAEQCYQVFLNTVNKINSSWNAATQLPFVIFPTWNDYEEGTALEMGIDNCYRPTLGISGNIVTVTLNPTDATYATPNSIQDWSYYYSDPSGGPWFQIASHIAATSLDISTIVPGGTWNVYAVMRGKTFVQNRVTNAVSYTH